MKVHQMVYVVFSINTRKKLKNVDAVYRNLTDNDIDKDELMNLCEIDLRETLNEIKMKKIQIGRMISVLRCCSDSTICNESHKHQGNIINPDMNVGNNGNNVVILSLEEQEALSSVQSKSESIALFLNEITKALNELQENTKENEAVIATKFDEIMSFISQRKQELTNECQKVGNEKNIALNKQMSDLQKYGSDLRQFYDLALEQREVDATQRRNDVINGRNALFSKNAKIETDKLAINPKFKVIIDVTAITQIVQNAGFIEDDDSFHPGQEESSTTKTDTKKSSAKAANKNLKNNKNKNSTSGNNNNTVKTVRKMEKEKESVAANVGKSDVPIENDEIQFDAQTGLPIFKDVSKYKLVLTEYCAHKGLRMKESVDEMEFGGNVLYQCTVEFGDKSFKGIGDSNKNVAISNTYLVAVGKGIPKSKAFELMAKHLPGFTKKNQKEENSKLKVVENAESPKDNDNNLMKFDVIEKRFESYLIRNGNGFKRDSSNKSDLGMNMSCASSFAIKKGDVYSFSIQVLSGDDYGAIGIASKIDCIPNGNMGWIRSDSEFGNTYFIVGKGKIMSGTETSPVTSQRYGIPKIEKNDVVTVKVDCQKWNIEFLINGQLVGKQVNITKSCTYHPVICTQSKNKEYVIV